VKIKHLPLTAIQ